MPVIPREPLGSALLRVRETLVERASQPLRQAGRQKVVGNVQVRSLAPQVVVVIFLFRGLGDLVHLLSQVSVSLAADRPEARLRPIPTAPPRRRSGRCSGRWPRPGPCCPPQPQQALRHPNNNFIQQHHQKSAAPRQLGLKSKKSEILKRSMPQKEMIERLVLLLRDDDEGGLSLILPGPSAAPLSQQAAH